MRTSMVMPLVFGVIFIIIIAAYALLLFLIPLPLFIKLLIGLVVLGIASAMVYVLIQRSRELKEEEKIDLSKY